MIRYIFEIKKLGVVNSNLWFKYQIFLTALCHQKPRNRRKTGLAPGNRRLHKNCSYFPPWEKGNWC
jgi:hypothetical protein